MVFDVIEFMEIVSSCFKRKIIPVFPADAVKLFSLRKALDKQSFS